jgi:hypothetical protein
VDADRRHGLRAYIRLVPAGRSAAPASRSLATISGAICMSVPQAPGPKGVEASVSVPGSI